MDILHVKYTKYCSFDKHPVIIYWKVQAEVSL